MSDAKSPSFKACETKRGADWSVLVTWPDERQQYLDGFQSLDDAVAWVNHKSQAWLEAQQLNASPSQPRRHDHIWSRFETSMAPSQADTPAPLDVATIDELIDVLDSHTNSSKSDRIARGDAFKDEQGRDGESSSEKD